MLILRRKMGESIVIGTDVTVTVVDINEGSIRLAIDAPRQIPILRSELLTEAADSNRAAAYPGAPAPEGLLRALEKKMTDSAPAAPAPEAPASEGVDAE